MNVITQNNTPPTNIWIGTSGYSFQCWEAVFYPVGTPANRMLDFYVRYFPTVELNYTFYRMPSVGTCYGMLRKAPPDLQFHVKGHQEFTHQRILRNVSTFCKGIEPLQKSGQLRGLLFQFPQSYHNTPANFDYLNQLVEHFQNYQTAIEFRHRSWASQSVYQYFEEKNLSIVTVDEPQISTLFPNIPLVTNDTGYIRLHSSNPDKWYSGKDRYDYNYSEKEIKNWANVIEQLSSRASDIFVYFNNCHRAQAAHNAQQMQKVIEQNFPDSNVVYPDRSLHTIHDGLWNFT